VREDIKGDNNTTQRSPGKTPKPSVSSTKGEENLIPSLIATLLSVKLIFNYSHTQTSKQIMDKRRIIEYLFNSVKLYNYTCQITNNGDHLK
jgi:hypothetical protein